jgi:hypothetical protein
VGDAIHRHDAWVLLGSIAQSLWWDKPQEFGPGTGQIPGENCGGNMPQTPCVESPERVEVMRDVGAFLGDSEGGFSGTDLVTLLRLEAEFGEGEDPQFDGQCTGPLGAACAADDWIVQLVDLAAATAGADMWDVAAAVKDRLITEPSIDTVSEAALLAQVMGVDDLATTVADVGAADAAEGARRLVGVLLNAPQFLLVGVAAADQPTTEDPSLVVPGTSTLALCDYLAPLVLDNSADGYTFTYSCNDDGITIGG